jgi:LmbE family N-acetylglucosaminyl deacetylase
LKQKGERDYDYIKKKGKRLAGIAIIIIILLAAPYGFLFSYSYGNDFSNSFYSLYSLSDKTAMVIVPHEDDELNAAGSMIKNLILEGCKVIIVFTTNGDYLNAGEKRINEALNSTKLLGLPSENVVFLGYGDQWDTEYKHIYYAMPDAVIKSHIGRTQTYGTDEHKDFRSDISGKPSLYTRQNYKNDVKDVILKYLPNYIFAVDFDGHQDHRAASLIFEEALGEILKLNKNYTPDVYKGFAYNTAFNAADDFYKLNMESTLIPEKDKLNNPVYELDTPNYNWKDRVRFPVPKDMLSYTIRANLLFKAFSAHKSQNVKSVTGRAANSDIVFWERSTESITYTADFTASSGNPNYLNDFKLIDSSDICSRYAVFDNCVWMPLNSDKEKSIRITFSSPRKIDLVSLYDNFSLADNILSGTLSFSDGTKVKVGALNKNGSRFDVQFPEKENISFVDFKINTYEGENPGLSEIEVYGTKDKASNDTQLRFVKLMLANNTNTFIYRYICEDTEEIPLGVYSYPYTLEKSQYTLKLIDYADGRAKLENNTLIFKKSFLTRKCKVRVELADNPKVYDEVEFVRNSFLQDALIKGMQYYEKTFDEILRICKKIL